MGAIEARGLRKTFGSGKTRVEALRGVDLDVEEGQVVGLLGPNGAGKTTVVRVLTTLLKADAGTATVLGHDVVSEDDAVRRSVGLSGQFSAIDEILTGRENLRMFGRLYGLAAAEADATADRLLAEFDLLDAADRVCKTYSGGMKRRLDLAGALVGDPRVLVLDEPTTGLDPKSRLDLWEVIRGRVGAGVTVLLTTQYLEEADALADQIAVIDRGVVIAHGTSDSLKADVGGERVELVVSDPARVDDAAAVLRGVEEGSEVGVDHDRRRLTMPTRRGAGALVEVVRDLDAAEIGIDDIGLRRPTLDDVFLTLTGHAAEHDAASGPTDAEEARA